MGNSPSKKPSATRELEKFTQPTGLYPTCPWDVKSARRLIVDRKIAPRFPGKDTKESCFTQECPICFMFYPGNLNSSACCKKPICSECFLQMKPPKKSICCPFCNQDGFSVKYAAPSVMQISSIYSEQHPTPPVADRRRHSSALEIQRHTAQAATVATDDSTLSHHYASVEDRQRIREDLRTELNLSSRPIRTSIPSTNHLGPYNMHFLASAADAARLEELMLMEALRRSMQDAQVKDTDAVGAEAEAARSSEALSDEYVYDDVYGEVDDDVHTGQSLRSSQVQLTMRRTSNPFDEEDEAPRSTQQQEQQNVAEWNPFAA